MSGKSGSIRFDTLFLFPLSLDPTDDQARERAKNRRRSDDGLTISNVPVPSDLPDLPSILVPLDVETLLGHSFPEDLDESVHLGDGDGKTARTREEIRSEFGPSESTEDNARRRERRRRVKEKRGRKELIAKTHSYL